MTQYENKHMTAEQIEQLDRSREAMADTLLFAGYLATLLTLPQIGAEFLAPVVSTFLVDANLTMAVYLPNGKVYWLTIEAAHVP